MKTVSVPEELSLVGETSEEIINILPWLVSLSFIDL